MKNKIFLAIQVLAGVMLIVFGLNKFLHFIPMSQPVPEMGAFIGALIHTGYMFPLIASIEILAGLAFVTNKFVPLAAIIVIPVMLNAFLAHLFLEPAGIGGAAFILTAIILTMVHHKSAYQGVLKA